ncbi:MAG TPA: methyltransferase domain-containing protein, partial [Ktedonobacterales bacterium]|nr:methyltransferase domain-containing protein [Ktedonobacterales bacterium]
MSHCQCDGIERCFNIQRVTKELTRYRRRGAAKNTRLLVKALRAQGIEGRTLLDIGGGVGAISHLLVQDGVRQAVDVDASAAYLAAAREEAERRGLAEQISFQHGDFVALAPTIPAADIVTLDRVICCYDDMPALVGLSAARAERLYGVVYPRDAWWVRLYIQILNTVQRMMRRPIRFFVHPTVAVDATIRAQGLDRRTT